MGNWQEEWEKSNTRFYIRSLSSIILRILRGSLLIAGIIWFSHWLYDTYQISLYWVIALDYGIPIAIISDMMKQNGAIRDLFVYFGNMILKKKLITYHTEINILQSKLSEIEAKNLELKNENSKLKGLKNECTQHKNISQPRDKTACDQRSRNTLFKLIIGMARVAHINLQEPGLAATLENATDEAGCRLPRSTGNKLLAEVSEYERKNIQ